MFRHFGMTADQFAVFRHLCRRDGISQRELGQLCAFDPTTMGRMLELLEGKSLVRRETDDQDRRTRRIFLIDAGRSMARQRYDVCQPIRETLETTLSPTAMNQLLRGTVCVERRPRPTGIRTTG
ncbi:MAG: MarR family transcriptional regulator [Planctomycetaceae bacterium]|nr:MarR family transcriptional regulator [Planctomycetaceae bacterium]